MIFNRARLYYVVTDCRKTFSLLSILKYFAVLNITVWMARRDTTLEAQHVIDEVGSLLFEPWHVISNNVAF